MRPALRTRPGRSRGRSETAEPDGQEVLEAERLATLRQSLAGLARDRRSSRRLRAFELLRAGTRCREPPARARPTRSRARPACRRRRAGRRRSGRTESDRSRSTSRRSAFSATNTATAPAQARVGVATSSTMSGRPSRCRVQLMRRTRQGAGRSISVTAVFPHRSGLTSGGSSRRWWSANEWQTRPCVTMASAPAGRRRRLLDSPPRPSRALVEGLPALAAGRRVVGRHRIEVERRVGPAAQVAEVALLRAAARARSSTRSPPPEPRRSCALGPDRSRRCA